MTKTNVIILAGAALLAGCSSVGDSPQIKVVQPPPVWDDLRDISVHVQRDLRVLADVRATKQSLQMTEEQKRQKAQDSGHVPQGFERRATLSSGYVEAEVACGYIAEAAGYKFDIFGVRPAKPLLVNINMIDQPVINFVHEFDSQVGGAFTIDIKERLQYVRCVYNTKTY